jgi:hypothetical protein
LLTASSSVGRFTSPQTRDLLPQNMVLSASDEKTMLIA